MRAVSHTGRVGPVLAALIVTVAVAGLSSPAHADEPGAPGPDPADYTPPFELAHPVEGAPGFSDTFGAIRDDGSRLHHGVDIGAPTETPVLAAAPGEISRIDTSETGGLFVEIRHTGGWRTRYLHLHNEPPPEPVEPPPVVDEADPATEEPTPEVATEPEPTRWGIPEGIAVGTKVAVGDVIGYVGYSGNASSSAPHLHFELRMPDYTPVNPYPFLTGRADATTRYVVPEITDDPITDNVDVIGHVDPGDGFISGVVAYGDIVYLGTYGSEGACPASGVRRYDVSNPAEALELDPVSDQHTGTWTPALWVGDVTTSWFSGTLAVVAHRACEDGTDRFGGLAFYDVSEPEAPVSLGVYDAGAGTSGVGDFDVWMDGQRLLVGAVVPNSLLDHPDAAGDVRIIDITDPSDPIDVADWDFRRDLGGEAQPDQEGARELRAEGITLDAEGRRAFVTQWDAGVAVLDLTVPARPELVRWHFPREHPEGNAAATAYDDERGLLAVFYQDLDPLDDEDGTADWGSVGLLGSDLSLTTVLSLETADPDAEGRIPLGGVYTPIDGTIFGQRLYAAWASGGLRILDLNQPDQPVEIASFLPPTRVDPQRQLSAPNGNIAMPLVRSVHVANDRLFVVDLNTGLWILELIEPPAGVE